MNIVGFDCGNSSFRTFLGKYEDKTLKMELVDQSSNAMVQVGSYYYWDILKIFDGLKTSIRKIINSGIHIDSIGVDTWGIDFALFDEKGNMLSNALSYRNTIGKKHLDLLSKDEQTDMFNKTGILCDKINSIYMMLGIKENMPTIWENADKLLMIPDILNFLLTGVMQNEPSEFSTTQLLDSKTKQISQRMLDKLNIKKELFSNIGEHGKFIGYLTEQIKTELEIDYDIPVVCVPSHDTAAAVLAVPAEEKDFIFISSGTWSLIGTELDAPLITDEVREASLTNEVGAFNKITLLKNNMGMFIIQRIRKEYNNVYSANSSWDDIVNMAKNASKTDCIMNVNDNRFFNPECMYKEIWSFLLETGQVEGEIDFGIITRCVYESMALSYQICIDNIEKISGKSFESIYIIGGGSRNAFLNRIVSSRLGKKVIACEGESTVLGTILTQIKYFDNDISISDLREIVKNSTKQQVFQEKLITDDAIKKIQKYI